MKTTPNLGLKKPDGTDVVDVTVLNGNADVLDTEVAKLASTTEPGRMSAADKAKLNGIAAGAGTAASATDAVIGNRTITDTTVPSGDSGTVTTLLGWMGNMIKGITGKSNWRTAPATTLEAVKGHMDAVSAHGATSSATASRIMIRDANGRAQVASPSVAADVSNKGYVDTAVSGAAVPDASSTVKGKVQLSSATNSTSEMLAATSAAVKAAYDRGSVGVSAAAAAQAKADAALPASAYTAADMLTKIKSVDGSGSGLDADTLDGQHGNYYAPLASPSFSGNVTAPSTTLSSSGDALIIPSGSLKIRGEYLPGLRDNGGALQMWTGGLWKQIQSHQLTASDGKSILNTGTNLNNLITPGFYNGSGYLNGPLGAAADGGWWYVEVFSHTNGTSYIMQRATHLTDNAAPVYVRICSGGTWAGWKKQLDQNDYNQLLNSSPKFILCDDINRGYSLQAGVASSIVPNQGIAPNGEFDATNRRLVTSSRGLYTFSFTVSIDGNSNNIIPGRLEAFVRVGTSGRSASAEYLLYAESLYDYYSSDMRPGMFYFNFPVTIPAGFEVRVFLLCYQQDLRVYVDNLYITKYPY